MKNKFIAHELRLSYHKNDNLSLPDFTTVSSSAIYFNTKLYVVGYQKIADGAWIWF